MVASAVSLHIIWCLLVALVLLPPGAASSANASNASAFDIAGLGIIPPNWRITVITGMNSE
jgi:hypothetical protein